MTQTRLTLQKLILDSYVARRYVERGITDKGRKNAVCGKVIGGGECVIFEWIAARLSNRPLFKLEFNCVTPRYPGRYQSNGPVVLCVAFEPRGSPEREKMTVLEREREREKSVCTLRDTFMAQSTVYSNIVTPSRKGTWRTATTKSIQPATSAVLHELLNERKIDSRLSVQRKSSLFYYQREIERGVQFELYRDESLEAFGTERRFGEVENRVSLRIFSSCELRERRTKVRVNGSEGKQSRIIWDGGTVREGFLKKYRRIDHRNARFSWQLYLTVRPLIPRDQWSGVNAVHTSLCPRTRIARIFLAGFDEKKEIHSPSRTGSRTGFYGAILAKLSE